MESSDVFDRTEEWARSIRESLADPRPEAETKVSASAASASEAEQTPPEQVHTPTRNRIQPQIPADTLRITPSHTRIILKANSVAESADTLESIPTIGTLETLESTFEKTLHARAMRAAGADLDVPTPVKTPRIARATFGMYGNSGNIGSNMSNTRHRDSLLRGHEGTRHRRRWENDHLMHVPNAQLPLPSDWQVHPTHPVHHNLPYHVAQYWDRGLCKYVNETRAAAAVLRRNQIVAQQSGIPVEQTALPSSRSKAKKSKASRKKKGPGSVISVATSDMSETGSEMSALHVPASMIGLVTRQLRVAAKRTPAVKVWVRALEAPIRQYLVSESIRLSRDVGDLVDSVSDMSVVSNVSASGFSDNGVSVSAGDDDEFHVESDSDDEVVFIGRRPLEQKMMEQKEETETETESWKRCSTVSSTVSASGDADDDADDAASDTTISPTAEGILFDDLGEGEKGSFKRWLAHSLSDYYGLTSTSSTVDSPGKPGNRIVYMSLREASKQADAGAILIPRPMWEIFDL